MEKGDESFGLEQPSPEQLPARPEKSGVYDKLKILSRGALGKLFLATTLMGGVAEVDAAEKNDPRPTQNAALQNKPDFTDEHVSRYLHGSPLRVAANGDVLVMNVKGVEMEVTPGPAPAPGRGGRQQRLYNPKPHTYVLVTLNGERIGIMLKNTVTENESDRPAQVTLKDPNFKDEKITRSYYADPIQVADNGEILTMEVETNTSMVEMPVIPRKSPTPGATPVPGLYHDPAKPGTFILITSEGERIGVIHGKHRRRPKKAFATPLTVDRVGIASSIEIDGVEYGVTKRAAPLNSTVAPGVYYFAKSKEYKLLLEQHGRKKVAEVVIKEVEPTSDFVPDMPEVGQEQKTALESIFSNAPAAQTTTQTPAPTMPSAPAATKKEASEQPDTFVPASPEILAAQEAVKAKGYLTIEHGYDKKNAFEAAIRGPSIIPPTGYQLTPAVIATRLEADGRSEVLMPCARDALDQNVAGVRVWVLQNGKQRDVEAKIIYSEPNKEGNGYVNPFVRVNLKGIKDEVSVCIEYWITIPEHPEVTEQQLSQRMGQAASAVTARALQAGCSIPWTEETDCRFKANIARKYGRSYVDVVEGFSFRPTQSYARYGGSHFINVARSPGGLVTFDAGSPTSKYIGPLKEFVATGIGAPYSIPSWSREAVEGANGGIYRNVRSYGHPALSTPGFGELGAQLTTLQAPPEIRAYAEALWQERMKVYDLGKLPQN